MTTDTVGGVWHYAMTLARGLGALGVEVELATLGGPVSAEQRHEAGAVTGLRLHEGGHRLLWMEDAWEDVAHSGCWLAELADRLGPDLLHLNDWGVAAETRGGPSLLVAHSCVLSWWRAVHGCAAPARWSRYRETVLRALARADRVVAPSRWMLDALEREYGWTGPGQVIPNGREAERYRPAPKQPFVLGAGRLWDAAKNVGALAEAARGLGWPVLLAGEGPEPGEAPPGPVRRLGPLPARELAWWMGRASVFAHPARYEPFGLAVLEAALCGCALVLSDVPSLRESWEGAAVFVPPDDTAQLRVELWALRHRPDRRRALGRAAAARAAGFDAARMARTYRALYRDLTQARPA